MSQIKPRKRQPHVCMRCGHQEVQIEHHPEVVDFKGLTISVDGIVESRCGHCGYCWTTDGQEADNLTILKNAYAAKRDEVRHREGLLTGAQIELILERLQLTRSEAAALFGGGPNAFGKYISGEVLQSYAMDRLLRVTLAFGDHALSFLRKGKDAPMNLYAGGFIFEGGSDVTSTSIQSTGPQLSGQSSRIIATTAHF